MTPQALGQFIRDPHNVGVWGTAAEVIISEIHSQLIIVEGCPAKEMAAYVIRNDRRIARSNRISLDALSGHDFVDEQKCLL